MFLKKEELKAVKASVGRLGVLSMALVYTLDMPEPMPVEFVRESLVMIAGRTAAALGEVDAIIRKKGGDTESGSGKE